MYGRKSNNRILVILIIIAFIYFISSYYFTFNMDEEFSMGLMKYNYIHIIHVDSFDVHPPLYYLLLKSFLNIFTFWTESVFIKTLLARIFSTIIFVSLLDVLTKILNQLNCKITITVILFYLFIPSIISYATTIRMYELAALFLSLELYYIIQFNKNNRIYYLVFLTLFAVITSYIHYFAAVSAGLFIFIFFIKYLCKRNWNKCIKYLISGICFILFYIPMFSFIKKQFNYESSNAFNWNNEISQIYCSLVGVNYGVGYLRIIFIVLIILFIILLLIWSFYNMDRIFNEYLIIDFVNMTLTIIIAVVSGIVKGTPFMSRYVYFDFVIYAFFFAYIFYDYLFNNKHKNRFLLFLLLILSLLFIFNSVKSITYNIKYFDIPSIKLYSTFQSWKHSKSPIINIDCKNYQTKFGKPLYISQSSIYLHSLNKRAQVYTKNESYLRYDLLGHDNKQLYDKLFNIKFNK